MAVWLSFFSFIYSLYVLIKLSLFWNSIYDAARILYLYFIGVANIQGQTPEFDLNFVDFFINFNENFSSDLYAFLMMKL